MFTRQMTKNEYVRALILNPCRHPFRSRLPDVTLFQVLVLGFESRPSASDLHVIPHPLIPHSCSMTFRYGCSACSLSLLLTWGENKPETYVVDPVARADGVAIGRTAALRAEVPAAAPNHTVRAR
jgi:hypothetical protein